MVLVIKRFDSRMVLYVWRELRAREEGKGVMGGTRQGLMSPQRGERSRLIGDREGMGVRKREERMGGRRRREETQ